MRPKSHFTSALSFLAIILMIWYAFHGQTPSSEVKDNLPETEWSTARALKHVKAISMKPHYVGSDAHNEVRDYILKEFRKMGMSVTTQKGYDISWNGNMSQPENILARIKGSEQGNKALVLLTHYDSDPHSSKGASDAGSGVATILESVRAFLATNKQPKNDIIICITDGEELGLNGASLFVNKHPWAKNIGFVLNFEARGSGGPSYVLVETNGGNRKIMEEFMAAGTDYPVANSLAYSIYKMIPNDTDLTIFRQDGDINGLNFAFIGDHYDYHTELDNYERLDRNTLAHQGSYLMPLLHHFSNLDMTDRVMVAQGDDLVYFPLPIVKMVSFPFSWLAAMILVSGALLLFLIILGIRKRRITAKHLFGGFIPFLGSLVIGYLLSNYGWLAVKNHEFFVDMNPVFPYNGYWMIAASAFAAVTISFFLYHKFYHRDRIASLSVAPLILLWIISLAIAFPVGDGGLIPDVYLGGAGFFLIPLFAGLIMLWLNIYQKRPSYILLLLLAVPAIFVFAPFIKAFPVALGMSILFVAAVLSALLFGLLIPILGHYRKKGLLAFGSLVVTIVCLCFAFAKAEFSPTQPKPTSLIYVQNQDDQTAQWATYDRALSDWTKEKLGDNPKEAKELNANSIDSKYGTGFTYAAKTIYQDLPEVALELVADSTVNDLRTVKFKVTSESDVHRYEIFADSKYEFEKAVVNGLKIQPSGKSKKPFANRWGNRFLSYYVKENAPLEMELTFDAATEPEIILYAASFDLLEQEQFNVSQRPLDQMSMPFVLNDAVLRKRTLKLSKDFRQPNDDVTYELVEPNAE
ncbi:MAG: M28 family peptidase [Nonlabens sp.]|uniref:M28 family peptidase n=1 Tax=Nonlabens sp. TaxID=1888209 RepID=UPI00321BE5C9